MSRRTLSSGRGCLYNTFTQFDPERSGSPRHRTTPEETTEMPPGVPYIVCNEAAERFSFYGMKTILIVFMQKYMRDAAGKPDHLDDEEARSWYHVFSMAVYVTPLLGAFLSDVVLGKYRTILYFSLVYCGGHLALGLNDTRAGLATGLALIALGAGGIKPCVSANVGDQFHPPVRPNPGDAARRHLGQQDRAVRTPDRAFRKCQPLCHTTHLNHRTDRHQARNSGSASGMSPTPTWLAGQFAAGWARGERVCEAPYHSLCRRWLNNHRPSSFSYRSSYLIS